MFNQTIQSMFEEPEDRYSPALRTLGLLSLGGAAYQSHRYLLRHNERYAERLYNAAVAFEDKSPNRWGRTFHLSERFSPYTLNEVFVPYSNLVNDFGQITPMGSHLQRLLGSDIDVAEQFSGMRFRRTDKASRFLTLTSDSRFQVAFAKSGKLTSSSSRYHAPLSPRNLNLDFRGRWWQPRRLKENFQAIKKSQHPYGYLGEIDALIAGKSEKLQPLFGRTGKSFRSFADQVGRDLFEWAERPLDLLSPMGLGLRAGSYNKLIHVPFVGEGGLINQVLKTRVLPIVAGAAALGYLDYKTGHTISNFGASLPLRANLLRADLTDMLPGARSVTDAYEDVVPGNQYGPLALPLGGAFLGALFHYGRVLQGHYATDGLREAGARLLPKAKIFSKLPKDDLGKAAGMLWEHLGAPGKGLVIGLAAMLPFVPGMLGSRKTGAELRRIYSGEEPVEVRSGRWWDLGASPWEGQRIKEYRPHWYQLFKSRARTKSIWGSEEDYWKHNPLLHPLRYLRDPYWLEKQNYEDRPYPITSPAFSNVPLLGPLLAATIGKLIKPVVRMHEEDWDGQDYTLYSNRLEPKGLRVESPFERQVQTVLSKKGYLVTPQEQVGDYRVDFSLRTRDGRKIAIEADGDSYHKHWAQQRDAKRQRDLESQGWEVLRLRSGDFFKDPDRTLNPILDRLQELGVPVVSAKGRDVHSGLLGLAAPKPKQEYSFMSALAKEFNAFTEWTGLPGFLLRTAVDKTYPNQDIGQDVELQGSRQINNFSRAYYDLELGAGLGPHPTGAPEGFGYTEPFRRFVQREMGIAQANEIPNTMPSWMPGSDYFVDFRTGDPYSKVSNGYARLPGTGYEALHPELEGLDAESYPDFIKFKILADVAPYSREFATFKGLVGKQVSGDTEATIAYEQVLERVRKMKESVVSTKERRFTDDAEEISGTVAAVSPLGLQLEEYPGRTFTFSSLGTSMADLSAAVLAEHNEYNRSQVAREVESRRGRLYDYLADQLGPGTSVSLTIPKGGTAGERVRAVIEAHGQIVNQDLMDQGLAVFRKDNAGAEAQGMYGWFGRLFGSVSEGLAFTGDNSALNPLRYAPSPANTKLWQNRIPLAQYETQEAIGTRMRRWDRPIDDFIKPYARGVVKRLTGQTIISSITEERRKLNTLSDMLGFLRSLSGEANRPQDRGRYTNQARRTAVGSDLFSDPLYVASTLADRDANYFRLFLKETDPDRRKQILDVVAPETARALEAQWAAQAARIAIAEGKDTGPIGEQGRLYTEEGLEEYEQARTQLGYGDYMRSKEIAEFFHDNDFQLPDADSIVLSDELDYEDVKLKIIQNEGYDRHDFNIFDDRAALLWRKPYLDGVARELTSGDTRDVETLRRQVEELMLAAANRNPDVRAVGLASAKSGSQVRVDVDIDDDEAMLKDMRRNPDKYDLD